MSMMKRLLEEDDGPEPRWQILPVTSPDEDGATHRLMEHIGKGRWTERQRGRFRQMRELAYHYNKEGYETPPTKEEVAEVKRFSLMERARVILG